MKTSPLLVLAVSSALASLVSVGCRDRKCDEAIAAQASPSASAAAAKKLAQEGNDDADVRSLCALLALPTPPERIGGRDWETSSIPTQTKGRFGWVRLTGETKKTADEVETFLQGVEVARWKANPSVASRACGKFRDDRDGRVVITVTYRTKGDATKGDYWNYVALGMGPNHATGTRWIIWGVSEESAKLGALRQARILMGMQDADISTLLEEWLGPDAVPPPR